METKKTQCHPQLVVNATCLLGEKGCYKNGKCHYIGNCEHKVLTHADRIRAMSDEELAEFISNCGCPDHSIDCSRSCKDCTMKWLQQPVGDDNG